MVKIKEVKMGSNLNTITKLHLQSFGFSEYYIKELVRELKAVSTNGGLKEYSASDIQLSVENRLSNSKIKAENREKLQRFLTWLKGESNVIAVDFLKGLSPEKRIEVLMGHLQELEKQEQTLKEETASIIMKARQMVATQ